MSHEQYLAEPRQERRRHQLHGARDEGAARGLERGLHVSLGIHLCVCMTRNKPKQPSAAVSYVTLKLTHEATPRKKSQQTTMAGYVRAHPPEQGGGVEQRKHFLLFGVLLTTRQQGVRQIQQKQTSHCMHHIIRTRRGGGRRARHKERGAGTAGGRRSLCSALILTHATHTHLYLVDGGDAVDRELDEGVLAREPEQRRRVPNELPQRHPAANRRKNERNSETVTLPCHTYHFVQMYLCKTD